MDCAMVFVVALVLFFRRFWLFDVAKGGENRGRIEFIISLCINSNLEGE